MIVIFNNPVGFIVLAVCRIGHKVVTDKITILLLVFGATTHVTDNAKQGIESPLDRLIGEIDSE